MRQAIFQSPLGPIYLQVSDNGLKTLSFSRPEDFEESETKSEIIERSIAALQQYFAGKIDALDSLPVVAAGTDFQQTVWQATRAIHGTTSYGELAQRIGKPSAYRAVARALGQNPVALAVPCHRVLGKNGSLTGFSAGLDRKEYLLRLEGVL